jgi:subtilisin family serine protease
LTPLATYIAGGMVCSAVSPMIGTAILGREMTLPEVYRSTLNCFTGPVGWVLGPYLFPDAVIVPTAAKNTPGVRQARGRNISLPPAGEIHFVRNEIIVEFDARATARYREALAQRLQLTPVEQQTFALTGRTLTRWRIDGSRSVPATLRALSAYGRVASAQANYTYLGQQGAPAATRAAKDDAGDAQYVVSKMRLREAHRVSGGDDVLVAVIDSQIDTKHPDLAGVFADEYDAIGNGGAPHLHGTGMAGAIASHVKLLGVAPKVKILAVRAFAGENESAESTTFSILKAVDWSAGKGARVLNMSFAGPADPALRTMLARANARGIVLIAAVGNAGPRSPPLYPAADPSVIGVTATDADDKLLPQANRGPQVAVAAPGVDVLAPAPGGSYQITSGTSIAAAHASGVAALLLARKPDMSAADVRRVLIGTAHNIVGKKTDTGVGVIDAYDAINSLPK